MHCKKAVIILALLAGATAHAGEFSGAEALVFTSHIVAFGPRPSGSPAIKKLEAYIIGELKVLGCQVIQDDFTSSTPLGQTPMKNIMARFPGSSGKAVAITGHYDTKSIPGTSFLGANDGGASAGFLLEMAKVLARDARKDDVYLVWFDGEEAIAQWSNYDSLYGSRHLAEKWGGGWSALAHQSAHQRRYDWRSGSGNSARHELFGAIERAGLADGRSPGIRQILPQKQRSYRR